MRGVRLLAAALVAVDGLQGRQTPRRASCRVRAGAGFGAPKKAGTTKARRKRPRPPPRAAPARPALDKWGLPVAEPEDEDAPREIDDASATMPAGWLEDEPLLIPDPSAEAPDDWDDVLRANLTGGYVMAKFAVQNMMRQRYGRILFTTSPAGRFGFEGQGNYSASKAGQVGLMRSLCKEVAKRKITVNCVSPGFIATELLDDLPDALRDEYRKSVPAKRFGTPEEVASAVLYLASAEASYITGATLDITGGL